MSRSLGNLYLGMKYKTLLCSLMPVKNMTYLFRLIVAITFPPGTQHMLVERGMIELFVGM